jgi:hypothetical protein
MRLSEFYKIYSGTFVVGLAAEEIYSYVRDMHSRTVNLFSTVNEIDIDCEYVTTNIYRRRSSVEVHEREKLTCTG